MLKAEIPADGAWHALKERPITHIDAPTHFVLVDIDRNGIGWCRNDGPAPITVEYTAREAANAKTRTEG